MIEPPTSYEGDAVALQYRAAYRAAADRLDRLRFSDASVAEIEAEKEQLLAEPGRTRRSGSGWGSRMRWRAAIRGGDERCFDAPRSGKILSHTSTPPDFF